MRDTSRSSYRTVKTDGTMGRQQQMILSLLKKRPGKTRLEISHLSGICLSSVCGRVDELIRAGRLEDNHKRICSISKRTAHVVRPA